MAWKKNKGMGEIEGDNYGCLRKYNYGSGAGWKTQGKYNHKDGRRRLDFNIKSKKRSRWS